MSIYMFQDPVYLVFWEIYYRRHRLIQVLSYIYISKPSDSYPNSYPAKLNKGRGLGVDK